MAPKSLWIVTAAVAAAAAAKSLQSCPTVRPHRRHPTRFPCSWDSPGKNTGVGCYFPLQCMKVKSENEAVQSCPTLSDPMDCCLPGSSVMDSDYSQEIKIYLLFRGKAMTKLDSIFKSRDITLPTKIQLGTAGVFPMVIYKCYS